MKRVVMAGRLAPLATYRTRPAEDGQWEADTEWLAPQLTLERLRKMEKYRRLAEMGIWPVAFMTGVPPEPVA